MIYEFIYSAMRVEIDFHRRTCKIKALVHNSSDSNVIHSMPEFIKCLTTSQSQKIKLPR